MQARLPSAGRSPQHLQSLCHYLHLLAELSLPERTNPDHLILPHAGLAHCFTQLAEAADQIVATTASNPPHANPHRVGSSPPPSLHVPGI